MSAQVPPGALASPWGAVFNVPLLASCAAALLAAATLVLSWLRLFYAVDFTDEAFYVSLSYRFALGDMPLRDEQNLAQLAALLVLPFVKLYLWASGGTEGIMLFTRHLHLAFTVAVGVVVFRALRAGLHWRDALLTAALCLAFVPFTIHNLSYNTLGSGLLTIGAFLLLPAKGSDEPGAWPTAASGVAHGLMAAVYPTLAPIILLFVFLLARPTFTPAARYLGGVALAALLPLALVLRAGWRDTFYILDYLGGFHAQLGGLDKLFAVVRGLLLHTPSVGWFAAVLTAVALWHQFRPAWLRFLLPLAPAALGLLWIEPNGTANLFLVVVVAAAGPLAYPFTRQHAIARHLMRWVWVPSFVAGLVTAWSSSNGAQNACIGMFPAAVASVALMQLAWGSLPTTAGLLRRARPLLGVAMPLLVLVPMVRGDYADYYGDPVQRHRLTHRVESGPYRGLFTRPERAAFVEQFQREVLPLLLPDDRVLVFVDWPGGYLLAGLRPAVNSLWLPTAPFWVPVNRDATFDYWRRSGNEPTVILLTKSAEHKADALLAYALAPPFREVADLGLFTLRRREPAP